MKPAETNAGGLIDNDPSPAGVSRTVREAPNRIFMMKQEELTSSRLHHVDGQPVWGRFLLYEREIHLRCVGWRRVMYRRIPLTRVQAALWRGESRRGNLVLRFTNGATWVLGVTGAGLIKYELERLLLRLPVRITRLV